MDFNQVSALIQEKCPELLRKTWKPVISNELSSSKLVTKFGGTNPFRGTNFQWPMCSYKGCGKQKSFICQINFAELPDELKTHHGRY